MRQLRRTINVMRNDGRILGRVIDERPRRQTGSGQQHGAMEQQTCVWEGGMESREEEREEYGRKWRKNGEKAEKEREKG